MPHFLPGKYMVRVIAQGFSEAKTGTIQFFFKFVPQCLVSEEGEKVSCADYERTCFMALTDKTIDFSVRNLRAIGFDGVSFEDLEPDRAGHFSFVGTDVEMECKHESYEGREREKWQLPMSGGSSVEHVPGVGKRLDALFGDALKLPTGTRTTAQAPAEPKLPVEGESAGNLPKDDIPF